jgi:Zn-dependent metalloprotease
LENLASIAQAQTLSTQVTAGMAERNVGSLCTALRRLGEAAQIRSDELNHTISSLEDSVPSQEFVAQGLGDVSSLPLSLLPDLAAALRAAGQTPGMVLQVQAAQSSLTSVDVTLRTTVCVYDAAGSEETSPSRLELVRTEDGPPSTDATVEETFTAILQALRFFREVLGRDVVAEIGAPVVAIVHYGNNFANAFWDGEHVVVGDGDGKILGRFSAYLEIFGDELAHVFTQEAGLGLEYQPGALNQSVRDVMGLLVKQYTLHQSVDESDWLLGAGLVAPGISGQALRSLRAPGTAYDNERLGKDPQVAHMSRYVKNDARRVGRFLNSGIPSHAFYLLATKLGGYAWETAGMIWYRALTSKAVMPAATFRSFAGLTVAVARRDYAEDPSIADAVEAAWREVGVTPQLTKRALGLISAHPASE